MNFHKWSGLDSEFSHEYDQIKKLTKALQIWSEESNTSVHLLTNFYISGEEIDAAVILPKNVIVIDLKSGSGKITGGENGDWLCSKSDDQQVIINENRKNPYLQARDKRYAMINYLEGRKSEIFPSQKADQMDFYHTSSFIVFDGVIEWNKEQLPVNVLPWFDVLSIDSVPEKLESIRSTAISLSQEEAWLIPTLLNLNNEDELFDKLDRNAEDHEKSIIKNDITVQTEKQLEETKLRSVEDTSDREKLLNVLSGIFVGIDSTQKIIVKTKDDEIYNVQLNEQFLPVSFDLQKLANEQAKIINKEEININLINVEISGNDIYLKDELNSYFVIEPEWLINVTALTEFDFCARSLFNKRFSLSQQNEYMMRGSIVHEVFEKILNDPDDVDGMKDELIDSFNNRGLDFALLKIDPDEMENSFVRPHLNALYKYRKSEDETISKITEVNTERFIINPILGLKGKIDAVVKEENGHRAIELKTGKSWGGKAKPGHSFQVQAYSLLMEMKMDSEILNPTVVYSGDYENKYYGSISRGVTFNYEDKSHIINLRNQLVLADYLFTLDYEKENPKKCNKCSQAEICKNLFKLELENDNNNLPFFYNDVNESAYTNEEKEFFNKYNKLLTEEYRLIKETQGNYLTKNLDERIKLGKCVSINNHQYIRTNEYILSCKNSSELREMDRCLLSDNLGPVDGECLEIVVLGVTASSIRIKTRAKLEFEPKYLDVFSSETAFERNYSAIYELINNEQLKKLKEILIFKDNPTGNESVQLEGIDFLHKSQRNSVQLAVGINDYLLIQGPPGTGKTLTIAHIVDQLYKNKEKVIISCYTHRAIDEVTRKLTKYAPTVPVYRLGIHSGNVNDLNSILLESIINEQDTLHEKVEAANEIISNHPVYIGTTHAWLSGRYDNLLEGELYDVAIIDEASQVIIPNALGVIRLAEKFILVGDHKQLPPVIQSEEAKGLTNTLFEILYNKEGTPQSVKEMLDIQHRMPKAISDFISCEFYDGLLNASDEASSRRLDVNIENSHYKEIFKSEYSIILVNVKSTGSVHTLNKSSVTEAEVIVNIFKDMLNNGVSPNQVGIIAPFRAQVAEIRRQIELNLYDYFRTSDEIKPVVDTVDRFQGDERDVIIFSLTLIDDTIPELLQDVRRLNVAISRARKKFIGVGNWDKVGGSETLTHLKEYVEQSDKSILVNSSEIDNFSDDV